MRIVQYYFLKMRYFQIKISQFLSFTLRKQLNFDFSENMQALTYNQHSSSGITLPIRQSSSLNLRRTADTPEKPQSKCSNVVINININTNFYGKIQSELNPIQSKLAKSSAIRSPIQKTLSSMPTKPIYNRFSQTNSGNAQNHVSASPSFLCLACNQTYPANFQGFQNHTKKHKIQEFERNSYRSKRISDLTQATYQNKSQTKGQAQKWSQAIELTPKSLEKQQKKQISETTENSENMKQNINKTSVIDKKKQSQITFRKQTQSYILDLMATHEQTPKPPLNSQQIQTHKIQVALPKIFYPIMSSYKLNHSKNLSGQSSLIIRAPVSNQLQIPFSSDNTQKMTQHPFRKQDTSKPSSVNKNFEFSNLVSFAQSQKVAPVEVAPISVSLDNSKTSLGQMVKTVEDGPNVQFIVSEIYNDTKMIKENQTGRSKFASPVPQPSTPIFPQSNQTFFLVEKSPRISQISSPSEIKPREYNYERVTSNQSCQKAAPIPKRRMPKNILAAWDFNQNK